MNNELGIIIVAGGTSTRYGEKNKLLEEIGGIPIIAHSLLTFRNICPDNQMVLVCHPDFMQIYKNLTSKYISANSFSFTTGGETRGDSVFNGLHILEKYNIKYAAIHDAARPLASANLMLKCFESCVKNGSAIAAKRITDTIKSANPEKKVTATIDRSNLWAIETPQIFKLQEILSAYTFLKTKGLSVTDDAGAMECSGKEVFLYENSEYNQKITYPWDLPLADFIHKRERSN